MITIQEVVDHLEQYAPLSYQEEYDNSGLLTGNREWPVTGVLLSLDCTEEIIEEARTTGCNLIVSHHPIIFRGLKRLTGQTYVERTVIKAIRSDIAIYAIHTNLDNVSNGVSWKIAQKLGLANVVVLSPKQNVLAKLTTFVPRQSVGEVAAALHAAGAGQIGDYKNCSFRVDGTGHFEPTGSADPTIGKLNEAQQVDETRLEMILPAGLEAAVIKALKVSHPYEEVAYYLQPLDNKNQHVGSGVIGDVVEPLEPIDFLRRLKTTMSTQCIRHTAPLKSRVRKVAICGGSGRFLLEEAIRQNADVFVSADFKYHEFFDADGKITIADIGHYESEQFTAELLGGILREKFTTFAINFSKKVTNPISYI